MNYSSNYNDKEQCNDIIINLAKPLKLGNNFTYEHFIDALSPHQVETIYRRVAWGLEDNITINAHGNCGGVVLNTCGSDFGDFISPAYNAIDWDSEPDLEQSIKNLKTMPKSSYMNYGNHRFQLLEGDQVLLTTQLVKDGIRILLLPTIDEALFLIA